MFVCLCMFTSIRSYYCAVVLVGKSFNQRTKLGMMRAPTEELSTLIWIKCSREFDIPFYRMQIAAIIHKSFIICIEIYGYAAFTKRNQLVCVRTLYVNRTNTTNNFIHQFHNSSTKSSCKHSDFVHILFNLGRNLVETRSTEPRRKTEWRAEERGRERNENRGKKKRGGREREGKMERKREGKR